MILGIMFMMPKPLLHEYDQIPYNNPSFNEGKTCTQLHGVLRLEIVGELLMIFLIHGKAQWDDIRIPPNTIVEARDLWKVTYPTSCQHATWSLDDLPNKELVLHQGSTVTSMDFHPSHHTLLLVGSTTGEITLWEVGIQDKLVSKPFKIWDMENCSMSFQVVNNMYKLIVTRLFLA
ncbi:Topless-related protein 3 [Camellia lanceoleosa]|uniref:Topless-related protein 3 n=1 Tax=Camellia lanceoleosa TaxID=1840588 RepID=A0ACC0HF92_9ERIC|nr:Topless-related protein 3 [Camellia lanceoleosa]